MKLLSIIKSIRKNLFGNSGENVNNVEESEYMDLTPESDAKNSEEYIRALHWAVNNGNIKNIALSGPYGSGKSSIIDTYLKQYPDTKYIKISLAAFATVPENNEYSGKRILTSDNLSEKEVDSIIEEGILKQLFYKVGTKKIPQSRYRKIKKFSYWKTFFVLLVLEILGMFVYYRVHSSGWGVATILLSAGIISYLIKLIISYFRIEKISIGGKADVTAKENKESVLDKALDEIVYFFESTSYDTVFIEDLDRFNRPNIFIKLRELNTIINNYEKIKRKIVFVYAISDDMFRNEERTKFFDFIIPVIPYVNATNSGEILREMLKFETGEDGIYKSTKYKISDRYIGMISPFIEDMRVLINICNEFFMYMRILKGTNLNDEEMFSMIAFKNLYPKEFAELEAEKGIVKEAFDAKKSIAANDGRTLKELIEEYGEDILPEKTRDYGILRFLLINGYINESYSDYINYFYPNSITREENNFLRSIRMRDKANNFSFEVKNPQQVFDRIYDMEFKQDETLNFILTDFIIKLPSSNKKKEIFFRSFNLEKNDDNHYRFMKEYIARGMFADKFIGELYKYGDLSCIGVLIEEMDISDISWLLENLGGEWVKLANNKYRHRETLATDNTGNKEKLLKKLKEKDYITSYEKMTDNDNDCFSVWVKQQ